MTRGFQRVVLAYVCVACASDAPEVERTLAGSLASISVFDAVAPAPANGETTAAYFTVVNSATDDDTLLEVTTTLGEATLHDVVSEGGRTRMRMVHALGVPAGGTLSLAPGGYHVMLSRLGSSVQIGDTVRISLRFAHAGTLSLPVAVVPYAEVGRRFQAADDQTR